MRYLGNKESILADIENLIESKGLLKEGLTFFDAFCGSGSVADHFKGFYNIVINDNLKWSVVYSKGRICAPRCSFSLLGFDPFEFLNNSPNTTEGFIYSNYAPTYTSRMYFTPYNASRIDYFRDEIEQWWVQGKLNEEEYCYLLASLIDSVSKVSNTAGVYGAYLKKWDNRALKEIVLSGVDYADAEPHSVTALNEKIENIIGDVDCDILYLDPPYTQNQYGTQYHLLETLILNDNPSISKVTGSRPTAPMRSDWSKEYKVNILFDKILSKTTAKYVILSYNSDGFMSKEYIEAAMKRYGKADTFVCKKISYKKYQNWKTTDKNPHYEYLFYIEMKPKEDVRYESPLNYIGSKAKIINNIIDYQPNGFTKFVDAFGGGFNVGINIKAGKTIYNDINHFVTALIKSFKDIDTYDYISYVKKTEKRFGLEKGNGEAYAKARDFYNSQGPNDRDPRLLYTIILYGYQQQIRFNSQHDFNNPIGMRWFNDKVLEKMVSFSRRIKELDVSFESVNYANLLDEIDAQTFVYFDPPYQMTRGSYNDGKRGFAGWNTQLESELFTFADRLNERNIPFMLSYISEHRGEINQVFLNWIDANDYNLIPLGEILGISGSRRKEVLVTNYEILK